MGSVSDSVVRHAPCPVLVARKAEEEQQTSVFPTKILLATDGSEEAELALRTAVDLAEKTDSELHVVHVGRLLGHAGGAAIARGPLPGGQDALDREARRLLEAQVEKIEAAGGGVARAHLGSSERRDAEIVSLAEEISAGLIAMGSRGLGGMQRLLLRSVSDSVVRHAHCPVLVAREKSR
ncbi:MAG: universal stress protein [Actinomycetota bacterium]|nr:universal stress protein [Actinomycetota bacterium]